MLSFLVWLLLLFLCWPIALLALLLYPVVWLLLLPLRLLGIGVDAVFSLLRVAFAYRAGASIPSLQASIQCEVVAQQGEAAQAPATQEAATFA